MKPKIFDLSIGESRRRGYSAMVGLLNTEIRRVPVGRFDDDADLIHTVTRIAVEEGIRSAFFILSLFRFESCLVVGRE